MHRDTVAQYDKANRSGFVIVGFDNGGRAREGVGGRTEPTAEDNG
jgi:hypothetical protein